MDSTNIAWQSSQTSAEDCKARALLAKGDLDDANKEITQAIEISRKICKYQPANCVAQREYSSNYSRMADIANVANGKNSLIPMVLRMKLPWIF